MKNKNICPKCNGNKIIRIPGETGIYGVGNNIASGFLKGTVNITRYMCCNCGFIEEWIDSKEDIIKLEEKYTR
ncbi:hypothetical protein R0131_14480 [Clostridium sp. AL.422]|uniref:hypothetical protein n=1 Tax=Clostridium TaxID=1485 RepID=UPI00293DDC4D|nr:MULTISPECIES: hypothetical protein [unclassified Clostridium]MDV4152032.1 hypothetical protein [Clostridium sp. AL.422]